MSLQPGAGAGTAGRGAGSTRSPSAGAGTPAQFPAAPRSGLPRDGTGQGQPRGLTGKGWGCSESRRALRCTGSGCRGSPFQVPRWPQGPPLSPPRAAGSVCPVTPRPPAAGTRSPPCACSRGPHSHPAARGGGQAGSKPPAPPSSAPSLAPCGQRALGQGDPRAPTLGGMGPPGHWYKPAPHFSATVHNPCGPQRVPPPALGGWTWGSPWGTGDLSPCWGRSVTWHWAAGAAGGDTAEKGRLPRSWSEISLRLPDSARGHHGTGPCCHQSCTSSREGWLLEWSHILAPHRPTPPPTALGLPGPWHNQPGGQGVGVLVSDPHLAPRQGSHRCHCLSLQPPQELPGLPQPPRCRPLAPALAVPAGTRSPGAASRSRVAAQAPRPRGPAVPVSLSPAGTPARLRCCCRGSSY